MANDPPMLRMHDVRVQFGKVLAVDGLSLELCGGDLLGLIGPNGAGKTTTLRAAAGLQPTSTGTVEVLGWNVLEHPIEVGQHIGFTPDEPALYDGLTVLQFLDFAGRCHRLPADLRRERIDHWLERLWLKEKRAAKVGTLSRGMKQRLGVARTLLSDPHLILMDEPAAGLDPAGRVEFRRLLASLRDQGKAIIVSSHILADLADYCTHIAIMGHGRLVQRGTVAEVAGGGHERGLYRVTLARPLGDVAGRLDGIAGLTQVRADGAVITFEFERDRAAAAGLLAQLLGVGLPVAEFRPLEPDLEEAYLRTGIRQVD